MNKNIGETDKVVRFLLATALIIAAFYLQDTIGMVLLAVGIVLNFTATVGWCGLYSLVGISTCKVHIKK